MKEYKNQYKAIKYIKMLDEAKKKDPNASNVQNTWLSKSVGIPNNGDGFYYQGKKKDDQGRLTNKVVEASNDYMKKIYEYIKKTDEGILIKKKIKDFDGFKMYALVPHDSPISVVPYILGMVIVFIKCVYLIIKQVPGYYLALEMFSSAFVIALILVCNSIIVLKRIKKQDAKADK